MIFTAPLVLLGLLALPGLYFLLRLTPPLARRVAFPPLALLRGLPPQERSPQNMPLWLLLLRQAAAALVIFGLAGPSLHRPPALPGNGPVLLVIDNGWAAATDWPARRDAALRVIAGAEQAGRGVAILPTARNAANMPPSLSNVMPAAQARQMVEALQPMPWPTDRNGAAAALQAAPPAASPATRIYLADGLGGPGFGAFMTQLHPDRTISNGVAANLLLPPALAANGVLIVREAAGAPGLNVLAQTAAGDVLARAPIGKSGSATIALPLALANRLARLTLDGPPSAGGTVLLDASSHAALVGLQSGSQAAQAPYLGALYYALRALPPGSQVVTGDLSTLIAGKASVIILADVPLDNAQIQAASDWAEAGGVMIRFAGPLTADAPDALAPDPLLPGDRRLGGALTWTAPQSLAAFPAASPFAGLAADASATVSRQILADPTQLDPATVWASLRDGTPLVLGKNFGHGYLVTILTTANANWSNLALAGVYPDMLARLVALSHGAPPKSGTPLPLLATLDAVGNQQSPAIAASLTPAGLNQTEISAAQPPGLYGNGAVSIALNLGGHVPLAQAAELPGAQPLNGAPPPVDFGPWALAAALALLAVDLLISLLLRGKLRVPAFRPGALLLLAVLAPPPARAQIPNAALSTTIAYVATGDAATDQISADGLGYLSALVSAHSSAQLAAPAAVAPGRDDLTLYPLIYWPILGNAPPPSPAACAALDRYMRHGGLLLIDTQGGDADAPGSGAGFAPGARAALERATACLGLPPLQPLTMADVPAHCFYIVPDFPGRFTGAPVYIAPPEARDADGVTPVIIGQNDWAGAWARDENGSPEQTPIPGGEDQRTIADRFGTNLVIYALTGSYKADQANITGMLDRLGQ